MSQALAATAGHRGTELVALSTVTADLVALRARNHATYRSSLAADGRHLPENLADVVADVTTFADPLVDGGVGTAWDSAARRWT